MIWNDLTVFLSGHNPFGYETEQETLVAIQTDDVVFDDFEEFQQVSQEAKDLILKLLVKKIDQRPSAEEALQSSFFRKNRNRRLSINVPGNIKIYNEKARKRWRASVNAVIGSMKFMSLNSSGKERLSRTSTKSGTSE